MNVGTEGARESWFEDQEVLIDELRSGAFTPQRAPILAGFEDLHEIGRGGQAVVYAGTQQSTKRRVAIKVLLDGAFASQVSRWRFEREIELVASLRHPNLVAIHDSGSSSDGHAYCVMEFIEGVPLDEYFALPNPCPDSIEALRARVALVARICDAVNYAHQRGVIHRDLKPSNIRIDRDGEPHILDFGLAKGPFNTSGAASARAVSLTGQFVGSLAWASPEQARGDSEAVDIRSDVYSLGMILFFGITGRFPYDVSLAFTAVIQNILNADPARPGVLNRAVNDDLDTITRRALAREPDRRYQTAGELAADLRRYLAGDPVAARADSTWYVIRRGIRRYRTVVAISAAVFASAIVFGVVMTVLYRRAARAEASARREAAQASAVTAFLGDMLASADPMAKGRDVTVRTVLDEASRNLDGSFKNEPGVRAALHEILGTTFRGLGEYTTSKSHLDGALAYYRREYGENDRHTIDVERRMGELLIDQSKFDDADRVLTTALKHARACLPSDDPSVLRAEGAMVLLRNAQGRWNDAGEILHSLLPRFERVFGPDDKETLAMTDNWAASLRSQARYVEAEAVYRRVLAAEMTSFGEKSPAALMTMTNIAVVLNSLGRLGEAEHLLRECTKDAKTVWGPEHRLTLRIESNLVFNLKEQGMHEEALKLALEVLEIEKRVLGPEHANTIHAMTAVSAIYQRLNKAPEELAYARDAYQIALRVFGKNNEDTLTAMHDYGSALMFSGRVDEAETVFRQNLDLCRKFYAKDHPDLAWTMNELAGAWVLQRKFDAAADLYADAIRIVRKGLPPDHYFLPWLLYNRGCCMRGAERYAESEVNLLECYRLYDAKEGNASDDTQATIRQLVKLYMLWGKPEEEKRFRALLNMPPPAPGGSKS